VADFTRPDPDKLLDSIKKKNDKERKGKLKIFFGMVAGVGKTYQMLFESQNLLKDGVDVVIGFVETHGRAETIKMLEGLEAVPRARVSYRDVIIEEMDIDAVLKRNPSLVLVDELAHTNAPGVRHKKRYQDVIELLDNGIDVFTTVNVQHLESRSATVEEITGVKVRETIPDSILEIADRIELIDITPEELQKRLKEGKIYSKEKASLAYDNFFKRGNLTALREMALQFTAKLVDKELVSYMLENKIESSWKSTDRILVAIGTSPYSEYLIRWTKRIAFNLKAGWIAVYIEKETKLTKDEEISLNKNISLARELGAEVFITTDSDVVNGILRVARQKRITQIIFGKSLKRSFKDIFRQSIADRIIRESADIDVYMVSAPGVGNGKKNFVFPQLNANPKELIYVIATIVVITVLSLFLEHFIGYWAIGLIYHV